MDEKTLKIVEKIKALLAKADPERNSNIHESAVAASMAQKLLIEYNLSIEEVKDFSETDKEKIERFDLKMYGIGNANRWHFSLLNHIASTNFCRVVLTDIRHFKNYSIIGKPHNVKVVGYLYEYLYKEIKRLAYKSCENYVSEEKTVGRYMFDFCTGAVKSVGEKLRENFNKAKSDSVKSNAIILRYDTEVEDFLGSIFKNLRNVTSVSVDKFGYENGIEAGRNIPINSGIEMTTRSERMIE